MSIARLNAVDAGLPRRLSVCDSDPGYDKHAKRLSGKIAVFLDGVELPEVASYDVDKGMVTRRVRRDDNSFILDEQGVPALERMSGRVEVRWLKEPVE